MIKEPSIKKLPHQPTPDMPIRNTPIKPDHPIQIPRATQSRDSRLIDACILYLYGDPHNGKRITKNVELAKISGAGEKTIQTCKISDKWEEFRLDQIAKQIEAREGTDLAFFQRSRTPEQVRMIADEQERQRLEIPHLEAQAELILNQMKESPPGSKMYPGLVTALQKITDMLEHRSGKAIQDDEVSDMQKALIKIAARRSKNPSRSRNGEKPALVIDALPE